MQLRGMSVSLVNHKFMQALFSLFPPVFIESREYLKVQIEWHPKTPFHCVAKPHIRVGKSAVTLPHGRLY